MRTIRIIRSVDLSRMVARLRTKNAQTHEYQAKRDYIEQISPKDARIIRSVQKVPHHQTVIQENFGISWNPGSYKILEPCETSGFQRVLDILEFTVLNWLGVQEFCWLLFEEAFLP